MRLTTLLGCLSVVVGESVPTTWMSHETCGRSEIPAYVPQDISPSRVHVFFRHGMRTDFERHACFRNGAQPEYQCSLRTEVGLEGGSSVLIKQFKTGCEVGQLVDYAEVQMKRLGKYLAQAYPDLIYSTNSTYLRSTDKQRTLGSLDLLVRNLFKDFRSAVVHTEEFSDDPLTLADKSCKRKDHLNDEFSTSQAFQQLTVNSDYFRQCSNMWRAEIGTPFPLYDSGDCLYAPRCAQVPLPGNIEPSTDLYACVWNLYSSLRHLKYGFDKRWTEGSDFSTLASTPLWRELMSVVRDPTVTLSLWATHDDTITSMLSSAGIWDGGWPKYAAFLAIEEYPEGSLRVIRDGVEIARRNNWEELVPRYAMDDALYKEACELNSDASARAPYADLLIRGLGVSALINILTR